MRKTFLKDSHEYNVTETMFANVTRKTHNAKKTFRFNEMKNNVGTVFFTELVSKINIWQ